MRYGQKNLLIGAFYCEGRFLPDGVHAAVEGDECVGAPRVDTERDRGRVGDAHGAHREAARRPGGGGISIPIIMITVDTKEKTVLDAKNLGIREYLVKPISPIALKKRICNVFGIKERV